MTGDPDTSDDHWREEALNRMNKASVVLDRIEADEPYRSSQIAT